MNNVLQMEHLDEEWIQEYAQSDRYLFDSVPFSSAEKASGAIPFNVQVATAEYRPCSSHTPMEARRIVQQTLKKN